MNVLCGISKIPHIQISCVQDGRSVEYALERNPSGDRGQAVLDAALGDQALDLAVGDELDVSLS